MRYPKSLACATTGITMVQFMSWRSPVEQTLDRLTGFCAFAWLPSLAFLLRLPQHTTYIRILASGSASKEPYPRHHPRAYCLPSSQWREPTYLLTFPPESADFRRMDVEWGAAGNEQCSCAKNIRTHSVLQSSWEPALSSLRTCPISNGISQSI
jgi:hypothetical protein